MRRLLGLSTLLTLLCVPALAYAGDKKDEEDDEADTSAPVQLGKDDFDGEEEEAAPAPKRLQGADQGADDSEKIEDDTFEDKGEKQFSFEDEEESETEAKPRGPGEDTAELYRNAQKKAGDLSADEEIMMWESYLRKYPKSLFEERIERRMDELSAELMGERVPGSDRGQGNNKDAALRQLTFATPVQFSSLDPRSRLSAGIELGIPNWFGPRIDFEYAFLREASAHAGFRHENNRYAIVVGGKYALVKSARTGTLVTGALDLKLFTNPSFLDLRPIVGVGQRFDVMGGLDVQAVFSMDAELQDPLGARYSGGLNAELRPNDTVAAFVETSMNFKHFGADEFDGPFRFMVATFGLRFSATKPRDEDGSGKLDIGLGANTPYSANYWGYYRGAISADANYLL